MGDVMRYRPGSWTLLARADFWLLIDVSTDHGLGARLWESLGERPDGRTVLAELLTSYSPFDLPGFAFAAPTADGVEVTVRFPAQITCDATVVRPDEQSPWVTTQLTGQRLVLSGPDGTDQAMLPLGIGLVPASLVVVDLASATPSSASGPVAPESDAVTTELDALTAQPGEGNSESATTETDAAEAGTGHGEFAGLLRGSAETEAATAPSPGLVVPTPDPPPTSELPLGVASAEPESPSHDNTWVWGGQEAPPALAPEAAGAPAPPPDTVEESSAGEAVKAPPAVDQWLRDADPVEGDHPVAHGAEQTVLAATCAAGHLTPAFATHCRVCRQPVPTQTAVAIPRPSLGVLRLDNGDAIDLERGAVLGRAPQAPRESSERPHLINLAAYGRDISRMHAEIVLDGWNVLVRDLGSANGTVINVPGRLPQQLVAHELQELEPGASVEIAEVTTIRFEPMSGS